MITVFSFIMAFVWSSLMIVVVSLLRKKMKIPLKMDTVLLSSLYVACMVRFFIPVEFGFVTPIELTNIYTTFYTFITKEFLITTLSISLVNLFLVVWLAVVIVKIFKFVITYFKYVDFYKTTGIEVKEKELSILRDVQNSYKKSLKINLFYSNHVKTPITFGIFKRVILLPNKTISNQDLHFIILHEFTHHYNNDLLVKMLTSLFCIVFWWNPFVYLLNKNLDNTLEIKCDLTITKDMSKTEKVKYLNIIKNFISEDLGKIKSLSGDVSFGMANSIQKSLTIERFLAIANSQTKSYKKTILSGFIAFFFFCTLMLSYMFVIQPAYSPSLDNYLITEFDNVSQFDGSYINENADGTYCIIMDDGTVINNISENAMKDALENDKYNMNEE